MATWTEQCRVVTGLSAASLGLVPGVEMRKEKFSFQEPTVALMDYIDYKQVVVQPVLRMRWGV